MNIHARQLFSAATLANIEEAGTAVLILTECLEKDEFLRSRLTRGEVTRLLLLLAACLAQLSADLREAMPELDAGAWADVASALQRVPASADDTLWFAIRSLTPATLMWLRVHRQRQPALFAFAHE